MYHYHHMIGQMVGNHKTLPEAQQTQGIESITQIITHGEKHDRGEMKYMNDYKNQTWSLKLEIPVSELFAFVHSLVTIFPPCTPPCRPTHPPPSQ